MIYHQLTNKLLLIDYQKSLIMIKEKNSYFYLGRIQIFTKAYFKEGINAPIKLVLVDNRIIISSVVLRVVVLASRV